MSRAMASRTDAATLDADLGARLRERGQRVTSQRLILNRVLREADRHLSAEALLEAGARRLPNLSLPTVYATLELFEELGIVRRVSAPGGAVLFDPRAGEHHHMVCRRCGSVEDLEARVDLRGAATAATATGARVDRAEVVVSGLCAGCAAAS